MIKAATAGSALGDGTGCGVSASPISAFKRVESDVHPGFRKPF
ncbi:hypothetical protein ACVOMV_34150 [Mesorhizobium atlanticum]